MSPVDISRLSDANNQLFIVTFFKTVFLVIIIGLLHGLVFLPVFLSLVSKNCCRRTDGTKTSKSSPPKVATNNGHSDGKQVGLRDGRIPTHYLAVAYGAQMR